MYLTLGTIPVSRKTTTPGQEYPRILQYAHTAPVDITNERFRREENGEGNGEGYFRMLQANPNKKVKLYTNYNPKTSKVNVSNGKGRKFLSLQ